MYVKRYFLRLKNIKISRNIEETYTLIYIFLNGNADLKSDDLLIASILRR